MRLKIIKVIKCAFMTVLIVLVPVSSHSMSLESSSKSKRSPPLAPRTEGPLESFSIIPNKDLLSLNVPDLIESPKAQSRINVVKENPSLDVGPLIEVTVSEGDAARLPCVHHPLNADDASRLVLWYRNETSRPFLSYDSRSQGVTTSNEVNSENSINLTNNKNTEAEGRIFLSNEGASLVIKGVQISDQAEYRCKVHYSHSPSAVSRLKLIVTNAVHRIQLLDSEGRRIGDHVGPLSEDSHLALSCKAKCSGELVSLEWLVEGKVIASSWTRTEDDLVISNLQFLLKRAHSHSSLTCRLNCKNSDTKSGVTASIIDASTTILMFYVPQATLIIDSAASQGLQTADGPPGGVTFRVTEGMTVSFICAVKARPPPYNISWLHNGRIIGSGSRRWTKLNSSLVVSPVTKDDTGLYTCLASNTEGDGQSNAVNLRVSHAPYCAGPPRRQIVVRKNNSVSLSCEVEAEPADITFTWTFDPSSKSRAIRPSTNMQIYSPNSDPKKKKTSANSTKAAQPEFHSDANNPRKSILTFTPESSIEGVVCFAKNHVGRMQVPCAFTLTFVDPPKPPQECSAKVLSPTQVQVTCASAYDKVKQKDGSTHMTPGLSYVLSPEAKTLSHLEVWDKYSLLYNLTGEKLDWLVNGLPPDSNLILRLYSSTSHSQSDPVILYVRTKPRYIPAVKSDVPDAPSIPSEEEPNVDSVADEAMEPKKSIVGILSLIFSLAGGTGVILALLILSIFFLKRRGRRRPGVAQLVIEPSSSLETSLCAIKDCSVSSDLHAESKA